MATPTFAPLATNTLTGTETSVTFSGINTSTYRDLRLVIEGLAVDPYAVIYYRMNGDTSTYVDSVMMRQTGGGRQGAEIINSDTKAIATYSGIETGERGVIVSDFMGAGDTAINTHILTRSDYFQDGATTTVTEAFASVYKLTDAITSIEVIINGGGLATGAVLSLWGIEG